MVRKIKLCELLEKEGNVINRVGIRIFVKFGEESYLRNCLVYDFRNYAMVRELLNYFKENNYVVEGRTTAYGKTENNVYKSTLEPQNAKYADNASIVELVREIEEVEKVIKDKINYIHKEYPLLIKRIEKCLRNNGLVVPTDDSEYIEKEDYIVGYHYLGGKNNWVNTSNNPYGEYIIEGVEEAITAAIKDFNNEWKDKVEVVSYQGEDAWWYFEFGFSFSKGVAENC